MLATVAWLSVAAVAICAIIVFGGGAIEFYIRGQIAKGLAGVPRDSSPANSQANGSDRPLYSSGPRTVTGNQQRLLIQMGPELRTQVRPFPISYLSTDL